MGFKLINLADAVELPVPGDLTPQDEAIVIAQYKGARTLEALQIDYQDIDQQIADGVSAEDLLRELAGHDSSEEK